MTFTVTELEGCSLLHVATRGDVNAAAGRLSTALDVRVATSAGSVALRGDVAVLWFGPGRWLIHAPNPNRRLEDLPGCAITDLSDSRRVFRLSGRGVTDRLAGSCPLDLSLRAMPPGSCALTQFDRFSVLLHRRSDDIFDLYVERSYVPALSGLSLPD